MTVLESFRLRGRVALVTGGAGLFGRQIVEALCEAGATTIMASRDLGKLEEYAQQLRGRGLLAHAMQLDQGEESSVLQLLEQIKQEHSGVDVLINNATARPMKRWDAPISQFVESMRINATGIFLMTRAFGDHMASRRMGSIVNVGSIQGCVGPDLTLYEGTAMGAPPDYFFHKGGMVQLTKFAAAQLGPSGVRVNCISPGGFYNNQNPTFVQRYNARTFLGRMANESDLKGVIVFLASDASAYVTGANIVVDGGYTVK
jgi:NAD(P)-dependent dehydrogenase (short-subunit alcohol dehydrogenase family)